MTATLPIACELGVFSKEERAEHQDRLQNHVLGKKLSLHEQGDAIVLRYALSEDTLLELSRWVAKESRCCPFLRFRLEVSGPSAEIELHLIGTKEARDFVHMTLGALETDRK